MAGNGNGFPWKCIALLAGGFAIGTAGVKILKSKDAKKVYTHTTAAALRAKDSVMKGYTTLKENCGDIVADAKAINEERARQEAEAVIEDTAADLAAAAE